MKNPSRLAGFFVCFLSSYAGAQSNRCSDVKFRVINDPRRSTGFKSPTTRLCDRGLIKDDWYRFVSEAGGELATKAPETHSCGATSPIWMNGPHPTVEEGTVNRTACTIGGRGRTCVYSFSIKVRNCSGFYIYKLREPQRCSLYCAGRLLVLVWKTGKKFGIFHVQYSRMDCISLHHGQPRAAIMNILHHGVKILVIVIPSQLLGESLTYIQKHNMLMESRPHVFQNL